MMGDDEAFFSGDKEDPPQHAIHSWLELDCLKEIPKYVLRVPVPPEGSAHRATLFVGAGFATSVPFHPYGRVTPHGMPYRRTLT